MYNKFWRNVFERKFFYTLISVMFCIFIQNISLGATWVSNIIYLSIIENVLDKFFDRFLLKFSFLWQINKTRTGHQCMCLNVLSKWNRVTYCENIHVVIWTMLFVKMFIYYLKRAIFFPNWVNNRQYNSFRVMNIM